MMSGDVQRHHRLRHAKAIHWCRRWNHVLQHQVASTQCRLDLPRSPEFPVSHAYRRITVWMSTALCSQTGDAITAVNSC